MYVAKVCLCDMATINVSTNIYGKLVLPEINVSTDYPLLTTLGSQLADWEIIVNGYYAMASGPGRALALDRPLPRGVALKKGFYQTKGYRILEPKKIYQEIDHFEDSDEAVLVLEAAKIPPEGALTYISSRCGVHPCNLYVLITPITSLAGSVQIAARVVEVGIHKLMILGFDLKSLLHGSGSAPIAPIHPNQVEMMGRVNDSIRYAGKVFFNVVHTNDHYLAEITKNIPSSSSNDYSKLFSEIFKSTNQDFYSIDLSIFSPAVVTINNTETGTVHNAGFVDKSMLAKAFGVSLTERIAGDEA